MRKAVVRSLVLIPFTFLFAEDAKAYLDPGSGSFLIQIVIASLAGAGLFINSQWSRIKSFMSKQKNNRQKDETHK